MTAKKSATRLTTKVAVLSLITFCLLFSPSAASARISEATEACLECHGSVTPGIVGDWQRSRHASVTPEEGIRAEKLSRRISADSVEASLQGYVVGCAECHMTTTDKHTDSYEHNGYQIHTVVTPEDCARCHPVESDQFRENLMSFAHVNLENNALYHTMTEAINGRQRFEKMKTLLEPPDQSTNDQSCRYCHGTKVTVERFAERQTVLGNMQFPVLNGWPNQGVGRINPDGSQGTCSACHARHQFSIEVARKPYTCAECHKGPDVPAYKVYEVSKHGNIFSSQKESWNFGSVPWTVGKDYTAPTCAACHVSLVVKEDGEIVSERTHRMNDRLDKRLFGLIYAHPHPISPNTSLIKNRAGLPLPTELTGEPADGFLIDKAEQERRLTTFKSVCQACHSSQWTENHFVGLERTLEVTNDMTLTATLILQEAWESGFAAGLPQGQNLFDEAIEKMWVRQWLFYANSTRFAAAMAGADYGVFAEGRWWMAENVQQMHDWLKFRLKKN